MMGSTSAPTPTATLLHSGTAPAGALTTVFTPPASCVGDPSLYYKTSSCMPKGWGAYWNAASYYSPGICPSGMVSAATPPAGFGPSIEAGETAIVCCPLSYTFSASSDQPWCYGPTTQTGSIQSATTTSSPNSVYPIQVRWQASDLPILETNPLASQPTATAIGSSGQNNTTAGTNGSDNLSGGAIAGIIVAVVVAGIFLGLTGGLFMPYWVLRQARKADELRAQQRRDALNLDANHGDFPGAPARTWDPNKPSPLGSHPSRKPTVSTIRSNTWLATTIEEDGDHGRGPAPHSDGQGLEHGDQYPQEYDDVYYHRPVKVGADDAWR